MGRYIIRRILYLLLVLVIITMAMYLIFYIMPPTDPALAFAGKLPTPEIVAEVRENFGLDKPWYVQYAYYVKGVFTYDLGPSLVIRGRDVNDIVETHFPNSLELGFYAFLFGLVFGVPLGVIAARSSVGEARSIVSAVGVGAGDLTSSDCCHPVCPPPPTTRILPVSYITAEP